ncbi:(deoxy)nucleoside triphosphate pyrophosphohydrolase [Pedobacter hartonius]|uniref:8-oxo-dGTP diphosphatase n=1 Tax=Pedobacter hartonius TaxID=425514 RepID=A0A1H3X1Y2_9SPHI|nr:(deoxy)nucleoside triphosphate pyrophosphohydrolase [Pedobacter hartonius]SDZ93396.1 8-oxo-dGTP diphosphatase [Pedobacter hartonius]
MIDVSCALITGHNGKVLVAQRSSVMRLPLKWEFPGGKVEPGETPEECLLRELAEELGVVVEIVKAMAPHEHAEIRLIPFVCVIRLGEIKLAEHAAFRWLGPDEMNTVDWAEADIPVVQQYLDGLKGT